MSVEETRVSSILCIEIEYFGVIMDKYIQL